MSYSFQIKAKSKDEAVSVVEANLDKVVVDQPIHAKDVPAVKLAVVGMIKALKDDSGQDVQVHVHGSCWGAERAGSALNQTNVDINVTLMNR